MNSLLDTTQARAADLGVTAQTQKRRVDADNALAWSLRRSDPERALAVSRRCFEVADDLAYLPGCAYSLVTTAFCELDRSDDATAHEHLLQAGPLFGPAQANGAARADILLATLYSRQQRFEDALALLTTALEACHAAGDTPGAVQALLQTSEVWYYRADFELALDCARRALALCEPSCQNEDKDNTSETDFLRSEALYALSRSLRQQGEHGRALAHALTALELKRGCGDRLGEAFVLNLLGLIHHDPLDCERAFEYYLAGVALSEQLGERRCRLALLGNIGELYDDIGDADGARRYTLESLALSEALGNHHTLAISLNGLGMMEREAGNLAAAGDYFQRALGLREHTGDKAGQAATLCQLADLYADAGQTELAAAAYARSLELVTACGHRYGEAKILFSLGTFCCAQGDLPRARTLFAAALAVAQEVQRLPFVRDSALALHGLSRDEGDFRQALEHFELYHATDKRLSGEEAKDKTRRMVTGFELEKAQRQNDWHKEQNAELQAANLKLSNLNQENAELLDRLRFQTERLQRQSEQDSLTGLYNRRFLERYLRQEFSRSRRYRRALSVAMLDIDHFKSVNDRFGHGVGDSVLKVVAEVFAQSLRAADVAARFGGEEFVLVLPETSLGDAALVCERVRRCVDAYPWANLHPELQVTVSIGVTGMNVTSGATTTVPSVSRSVSAAPKSHADGFEHLLARADDKLYEAKRGGRNRVQS